MHHVQVRDGFSLLLLNLNKLIMLNVHTVSVNFTFLSLQLIHIVLLVIHISANQLLLLITNDTVSFIFYSL